MEIPFETVRVEGVSFDFAQDNDESYVTVASLSRALKVDAAFLRNIIRRREPFNDLCKKFEQRDSKNRLQEQLGVPFALLSGLFVAAMNSSKAKKDVKLRNNLKKIMTLFTFLGNKLMGNYIEMGNDLLVIMEAQNAQREVFNERANLSSKMRDSKKLIDNYYKKYEHRLSGQLELGS